MNIHLRNFSKYTVSGMPTAVIRSFFFASLFSRKWQEDAVSVRTHVLCGEDTSIIDCI